MGDIIESIVQAYPAPPNSLEKKQKQTNQMQEKRVNFQRWAPQSYILRFKFWDTDFY